MNQTSETNSSSVIQHPPGYRLRRGRNWFFLGLLYAGYYLCRYNLGIVAPELSKALGFNNKQTGWISTGRDFGYAFGQFVNGLFADALGGKQSMAIGAVGTIVLNLIFGWFSTSTVSWLLIGLVAIRVFDGYMQSFGAPGMVKINTSWFQRRERGKFAGIFGGMIQMGQIGVNQLSGLLLGGFSVAVIGLSLEKQDWRIMFVVPPVLLFVLLILAWFNVKNHPEEAGYPITHEGDDHSDDPHQRLPIRQVFRTVAGNPLAWISGGAYFCTGFVRRAYDYWWAKYVLEVWGIDKSSHLFLWLGFLLPFAGFVGSFGSGWLSDTIFKGRRSPVAALLYGIETVVILATLYVLGHSQLGSPLIACALLTLISLTCNSSHSIIGTAVAMDIGGRKMAGFALGVVNSFQYYGAMLAGFALGSVIDEYGWNSLFYSMVPFSFLGFLLMCGVSLRTRGKDIRGA